MLNFFEELKSVIHNNSELFGLLTFFLGTGFGHWLDLSRDKRKEFNDAALPVRAWLIDEICNPSPYQNPPTKIEMDIFLSKLGIFKRFLFMSYYQKQNLEREKAQIRDAWGQSSYADSTKIIEQLENCLKFTKPI